MGLSVRIRFEVFKRDAFTCQYCGRKSPEVVLEVDHIIPSAGGGSDDPINLRTSCWDCNRGKRDTPLNEVVTGEDPHDRAILILERERQLAEYNRVLAADKERREEETWALVRYWNEERGVEDVGRANTNEYRWLLNVLQHCPREQIRDFMDYALFREVTKNMRYVMACVRNWRERQEQEADRSAAADGAAASDEFAADYQAYLRERAIEDVMRTIREAAYRRRQLGCCDHRDPECASFIECVVRQAYLKLGIEPKPGTF